MIDKEKIEEIKARAKENHVPILQDDSLQLIKTILEIFVNKGFNFSNGFTDMSLHIIQ